MLTAGIREMKIHLSGYLEKVKKGESLTITERGKKIAVVLPLERMNVNPRINRLVEKGVVLGKLGKLIGLSPRIKLKGKPMSRTILEDRVW